MCNEFGARHWHVTDRYVDDHGRLAVQRIRQQGSEIHRVLRPHADCAERLGKLDDVGIVQLGPVCSGKELVEVAGNVSLGVVSEDDGRYVDPVLDRRGKFN